MIKIVVSICVLNLWIHQSTTVTVNYENYQSVTYNGCQPSFVASGGWLYKIFSKCLNGLCK